MDEDERGVEPGPKAGDAVGEADDASLRDGLEVAAEIDPADPDAPGGTLFMPAPSPAPGDAPREGAASGGPSGARDGRRAACRRAVVAITASAVVIVLAAVVAFVTYDMGLWGGVSVPQVTGLSAADASSALEQAGLLVERVEVPTDDAAGAALGTDPAAGVRVARGGTVTLRIGVPRMVPKVMGLSLADAEAALSQAGIANVRLEYRNSDEAEGTVLDVLPDEGNVVTQDDEVALVIAQPYTVPDVVGLDQDSAAKAIGEAGLQSKIEWQESEKDAYTVLSTSPAAGARSSSGATVVVTVASPGPRSETYLPDYLAATSRGVVSYLRWKGWTFDFGTTAQLANGTTVAEEGWSRSGVGSLVFTPAPESSHHGIFLGGLFTSDVLEEGTPIAGVRFVPALAGDDANPAVDAASVNTWMQRCGLSGLSGIVTGDDVVAAVADAQTPTSMVCGWGTQGGNVWSVVVIKGFGVAVSCAPSSAYDGVDLSAYGGSLGIYLAYISGFTG